MARKSTMPGRWLRLGTSVAAGVLALLPASAFAATSSDSASVPAADTDYSQTVTVDRFDPSLGTLLSVTLTLDGAIDGVMQVENTSSSSPSDGLIELSGIFTLSALDEPCIPLVTGALPTHAQSYGLAVFDGALDFAGNSGLSVPGAAVGTVSETFDDPAALAAFTGPGEIALTLEAVAMSTASGDTGNIESRFSTQASASVGVAYEYTEAGLPAIDIEKTPDQQTVLVGEDALFTITVTNPGPVDLVNVEVTDPRAPDCDLFVGALAVGDTVSHDCVAPAVTEPFKNVAYVTGEDDDGNPVDDDDDAVVDVGDVLGIGAILIEKTPDLQTVAVGDDVEFTITVTNTGPVDLVNVVVSDPRAPDCDRVIGTLAVGETTSYQCTASNVAQPFTNVATVTGDDGNGNDVTDSDDARVEVGDVLPLTGIDSSFIALAGLALLTTGFALVLVARGQARPLLVLLVVFFLAAPMVAGVGRAAAATEGTEVHGDALAARATNWDDRFTFPQFDPSQGVLVEATLAVSGSLAATMSVENTSTSSPCFATLDWSGRLMVDTNDGPLELLASASEGRRLGVFDGVHDYSGGSGVFFETENAVDSGVVAITDPAALESFTGSGEVQFDIAASAATFVSGCGNIHQALTTIAAAEATLTYRFEQGPAGPEIDIEKHTNGEDADLPTGPSITIGDPVLWEYFVTNTGDVALSDVTVTDDQGVPVSCPQDALAVGETMTCTGNGVAEEGQYANVGTVTGVTDDSVIVHDEDPSHYFGSTVRTWVDCAHGALGCLGIGGEAPGPVEVFIDGEQVECETESQVGTVLERFSCMFDSRFLPETVTIEVYSAGELLWTGTDITTVCFETTVPPPDDPGNETGHGSDGDSAPRDRGVGRAGGGGDAPDSPPDDEPVTREDAGGGGDPTDPGGDARDRTADDGAGTAADRDGAVAGDDDLSDEPAGDPTDETREPNGGTAERPATSKDHGSNRDDGATDTVTREASAPNSDGEPAIECPDQPAERHRSGSTAEDADRCIEPDEEHHRLSEVVVREDD